MFSQHDPTSQIGGPSYCKNRPKVIFSQYEPLNQCELTPEMLDDHTVHKLVLIKIKYTSLVVDIAIILELQDQKTKQKPKLTILT